METVARMRSIGKVLVSAKLPQRACRLNATAPAPGRDHSRTVHQAEDLASSSCLPPDSVGSGRSLNADVPQASGLHSTNTVLQNAVLCAAGVSLLVAGQALALPATWDAEHAHNHQEIFTLASNEDFWQNLGRYGRYFITVLLGTAYTSVKPVGRLLRNPVTAGLVIAVAVGLYFFVSNTLNGMLGVNQEPLDLSFLS